MSYQTARQHIQEDSKRPHNRCDILSSHILLEYQPAMFKVHLSQKARNFSINS